MTHQPELFKPEFRNGDWERARLAYAFVRLTFPALRKEIFCGTKFSADRRKPHAGGVRSPCAGLSSGFNFGIRVKSFHDFNPLWSTGRFHEVDVCPAVESHFEVAPFSGGRRNNDHQKFQQRLLANAKRCAPRGMATSNPARQDGAAEIVSGSKISRFLSGEQRLVVRRPRHEKGFRSRRWSWRVHSEKDLSFTTNSVPEQPEKK